MEFSPIVIQRKSTAPPGGSSNPFDDFDIHTLQISSPNLQQSATQQRFERFDSEEDPFNLFSDDSSVASRPSPAKLPQSQVKRPSGLRKEAAKQDDSEEEEYSNAEDSESSADRPPVPPRGIIPDQWVQRIREPVIPFNSDDAQLYAFLAKPLDEGSYLRMVVVHDQVNKMFKLIQTSTHRIVLTAHKRTDGLKALSLATNFSIMMLPTDRALNNAQPTMSKAASPTEPVRIAKLRGNTMGSQYSLFDQGKSPTKAAGVIEVRRELMAVRFELIQSIYTRRAAHCFLPVPGQLRRPTHKEDLLVERAKKNDPTVLLLSPNVPNYPRLPRFEDFQGFAAVHSIKNLMLHNPATKQVVFRLGKQDKMQSHLEFTHPFSVLTAFALALASYDSKIHPNHQL